MAAEKVSEHSDQIIQSGVDFLDRKAKTWDNAQKELLKKFNPSGKDVFSDGATLDDKKTFVQNVIDFQKSQKLEADGKPGTETLKKIETSSVTTEAQKELTEVEKQELARTVAQRDVDRVFQKFSDTYKNPDGTAIMKFSDTQILARLLPLRGANGYNELKALNYKDITPDRQKVLDRLVSLYGKNKVDKAINTLLGLFDKHGVATGVVKRGTQQGTDRLNIGVDTSAEASAAPKAQPKIVKRDRMGLGE